MRNRFSRIIRKSAEVDYFTKNLTHGDEGGFAPNLAGGTEDALDSIKLAVTNAGYTFGDDVMIALDCAASEFYVNGKYDYTEFEGETGKIRTSEEQASYLAELTEKYPIFLS